MIILTRLNGESFAVNPDLLERVDCTPDTILTLLDGTKYVVAEPISAVIDQVRDFRASVIAAARTYDDPAPRAGRPPVELVDEPELAPPVPLRRSRRP